MSHSDLPKLIQEVLYAEQHSLLEDPFGRSLQRIVSLGIADGFVEDQISGRVHRHKIQQAFAGPFPVPRLTVGEIILGLDLRGRQVHCPLQALNAHALTLGNSGSGKTTKSRFLALQVARLVQGMWLFDLRKAEFGMLQSLLMRIGVVLIVLLARQLRINPLQVPWGVQPMDWAARITDVLVIVLRLPPRASKILHTRIVQLYTDFGIVRGLRRFPTLFDLREAVAADTDTNPQAREAILDSLDPVLLSIGCALRYRVGWTTRDLAKRHIVFELGGISEVDKDLILNTLLLSEFTSRLAQRVSNPRMDLWICCDEAARLVSASNPTAGIADLIGLVRGTGIGVDLSIQSSDIHPAVLSNTATKVIGRCGSATDYETIGAAMGLTREQHQWMRLNLRPGVFIAQLGEGQWRHPFVFQVPPMKLEAAPPSSANPTDLMQLPSQPA